VMMVLEREVERGGGGGVEALLKDLVFWQGDEREVGRLGTEGDQEVTTRSLLALDR
jgi:hypothetical protein